MKTHDTLKMEIKKEDGTILKHVGTGYSYLGSQKHLADIYKDEEGNIEYVDRVAKPIIFTPYSKWTAEGNMTSFALIFESLLANLKKKCSDEELDKFILQCQHPLEKAKEFFKKQSPEDFEQMFFNSLNEKVEEKIKVSAIDNPSFTIELKRLINAPRLQNNSALHNTIVLSLHNLENNLYGEEKS